jgi:riboflavin kinase / FMN adenylyltransferase
MAPTPSARALAPQAPQPGATAFPIGVWDRRDPMTSAGAVEEEGRRLLSAGGVPSVVTIGTFDGVHRGHRALLAAASAAARNRGLQCVAVTFSPRPDVVWGRSTLPDICTLEERVTRLRRAGADRVVVLPFSKAFAAIPYNVFAEMLTDCLHMRLLHVGSDFALGAGREGTPAKLRQIGVEVRTHPLVMAANGQAKVSSSTIRSLIGT